MTGGSAAARVVVIGVGTPYRSDDGVGPVVAARLAEWFAADERVRVADVDGEPVRLIQTWEGAEHVIVVDAVRSGAEAGTVHHFTADQLHEVGAAAGEAMVASGHALGLGDAVALAAAVGQLPPTLEVVAVEGHSFELGEGLTPAVAAACGSVVAHLTARVQALLR